MSRVQSDCPYVGLRPFREADYPFFFGRERDVRVIASNVLSKRLTVLYGLSGVGKSSILQAGVVPYIRNVASVAVVYFNEWQNAAFLEQLAARCRELQQGHAAEAGQAAPSWIEAPPPNQLIANAIATEGETLDDLIAKSAERVVLILDQFEEFLLYHPSAGSGEALESALARTVNRQDIRATVLIGIREDALSKLDQRFSIRVANLLGNTLPLTHLGLEAARAAIVKPLEELNRLTSGLQDPFTIEPALVDEILRQIQSGPELTGDSAGIAAAAVDERRIETAYLQLVLRRLWNEEATQGSTTLRMDTLTRSIGGARQIVETHVREVMNALPDGHDREMAAKMFRYLVTPSRTKIAQSLTDLVSYAEAPEPDVKRVLALLADRPEARVLRRLANPERFELFHDVLAQPVLDWRRAYFESKDRAALEEQNRVEAERQQRELDQARRIAKAEQERADAQRESARLFRRLAVAMGIAALIAIGLAGYALVMRRQADDFRELADAERAKAEAAQREAEASALDARSARQEAEASLARAMGEEEKAKRLDEEARASRAEADKSRMLASLAAASVEAQARLTQDQKQALGQIELLRSQLADAKENERELETQVDSLKDGMDTAAKEIGRLKLQLSDLSATLRFVQPGMSFVNGVVCCLVRDEFGVYALTTGFAFRSGSGSPLKHARTAGVPNLPEISLATVGADITYSTLIGGKVRIGGVYPGSSALVGDEVTSYGRSGPLTGKITGLNARAGPANAPYGARATAFGGISGLIRTTSISRDDDGGAPVLTKDNRLLGIIHAGDEKSESFVIPVDTILKALNVELVLDKPTR